MKARYFYERLLKYPKKSSNSNKYYYRYSNQNIMIHHKRNETEWYVVWADGSVTKQNSDGSIRDFCKVDDLIGDDFEIFNIVQIIKSGYLVLDENNNDNPITDMRKVVSRLHNYIDSLDVPYHLFNDRRTDIPHLCGGSCWSNGLTDEFQYHAVNSIELHVRTIRILCRENMERKYYDVKPIPFIESMGSNTSVHVSFVHNMGMNDYKETRKKCNEALKDLLTYMDIIGIKCKWVDCKMKYPVYL